MRKSISILIMLILSLLFSCSSNKKENEAQDLEISDYTDEYRKEPGWKNIDTNLENRNGFIYTEIRTDSGQYLVWVKYEWADSAKIPEGSRNIVISKDCYSIDTEFLRIGEVAHYDYLQNGQAINIEENDYPERNYIIPDTEGDVVTKATIEVLEKRYRYNRASNRLYRGGRFK